MVGSSLRYFYIYITDRGLDMFQGGVEGTGTPTQFLFADMQKPENKLYSRVFTLYSLSNSSNSARTSSVDFVFISLFLSSPAPRNPLT